MIDDPTRRAFLALPATATFLQSAPRTAELQKLVDDAAAHGGGTVLIPPGRHVTGTLVLRSHVRLWLEPGAVLEASRNLADFRVLSGPIRGYTDNYTDKSLIHAEDAEDVSIEGRGTIDGQGATFKGPYKVRPYLIRMIRCRNVAVSGITIRDSPMWVQHYLSCDGVAIHGITVRSHVNANNDGIDIDCSSRVRISDCDISSGDDAIVLKSTALELCRDVAVTNCTISSRCNAFKLGTETNGGFHDVVMSNCTIYDTRLAGIALEIVDGGEMNGVAISNVSMRDVGAPLFLRLGDRGRPFQPGGAKQPAGRMRNVTISGVRGRGCGSNGCAIAGLPGHPIENVSLSDIRLEFVGGGTAEQSRRVPEELPAAYPEYRMFGALPAYGIYGRHVRGLRLRDVELACEKPDARPPIACFDVESLFTENTPPATKAGG
ncbi:MAG TPA: glycosyl hydrolase family 28 protein [Bryobacteraceae bacterium]|nr:glycosyl hydrolase family 28 protein [Bryobacteraceae bacterium]